MVASDGGSCCWRLLLAGGSAVHLQAQLHTGRQPDCCNKLTLRRAAHRPRGSALLPTAWLCDRTAGRSGSRGGRVGDAIWDAVGEGVEGGDARSGGLRESAVIESVHRGRPAEAAIGAGAAV